MNISISNLIDNATRPGTVDPLEAALMAEWPMKDDGVQSKGPVAANLLTGGCHYSLTANSGIGILSAINFSSNYTFAISVSILSAPTSTQPIWVGNNGGNKYGLQIDGSGSGDWEFQTGSNKITHPYGTWALDRWDRVVCVYDGSNYIMYINGVAVTTGASGDGALYLEDILQDGGVTNAANAMGGKMEVYSEAWTASDVTFDYNEKNSADGLFVFDNGTSAITYADAEIIYPGASANSTIIDYSGNSNNGSAFTGFLSTQSVSAPYNSRCIQLANWRNGYTIVGLGRGLSWNFPDPNNPTQDISGAAIGRKKKTSVSADEGMNFVLTTTGAGVVEIPDDTVLTMDGAQGFSVSFWVYIGASPSPAGIGVLMDKGGLLISMTAADELGFTLVATNANQMKDTTAGTASVGWNHICFTYNGTDETKLYLNGTETGSDSSALGAGIKDNTDNLLFGNSGSVMSGGSGRNMNWLGWYNKALTPTQVTTVYNARLGVH